MELDLMQAMRERHSVRQYTEEPIAPEVRAELQALIDDANAQSGLHMQLVCDDAAAFDGMMAHYGKFSGVRNYLALVGPRGASLEEECGYWGEKIVLAAQALGLNSCWVAMTFSKSAAKRAVKIAPGEKLAIVVALGHGAAGGAAHKSKQVEELASGVDLGSAPEWFRAGVEAAALAPTAMNQQKFRFSLGADGEPRVESLGGLYSKIDLGIVKRHFELASGKKPA